jgi:hypothetical protein
VNLSPDPHLLFIALCDEAHQPCRIGRPRSGHENKAQKSLWAHLEKEIKVTRVTTIMQAYTNVGFSKKLENT